jgi:putative methylase
MKLRHLEMLLEKVGGFTDPKVEKEQYPTPAPLAARLLYHAFMNGDIKDREVADLGCGTGILSIGAGLLGASGVTGIDIDEKALITAKKNAETLCVTPRFIKAEITSSCILPDSYDTIVMNPPFGAQQRYADRAFIDCALRSCNETYTIANSGSLAFFRSYTRDRAVIREVTEGVLPLRHSFHFHRKDVQNISVEIIHLSRCEPL